MRKLFLFLLLTTPCFGSLEFCRMVVKLAASHPAVYAGYSSGQCTRNIRRVLEVMNHEKEKSTFDLSKVKVLFVRIPNNAAGERFKAEYWRSHGGTIEEPMFHHTVMLLSYGDGHIVDFEYGTTGAETPTVKDYFAKMFPKSIGKLEVGEMPGADFVANYPVIDIRDESPLYGDEAVKWNAAWGKVKYVPLADFLK